MNRTIGTYLLRGDRAERTQLVAFLQVVYVVQHVIGYHIVKRTGIAGRVR